MRRNLHITPTAVGQLVDLRGCVTGLNLGIITKIWTEGAPGKQRATVKWEREWGGGDEDETEHALGELIQWADDSVDDVPTPSASRPRFKPGDRVRGVRRWHSITATVRVCYTSDDGLVSYAIRPDVPYEGDSSINLSFAECNLEPLEEWVTCPGEHRTPEGLRILWGAGELERKVEG